MPLYMPQRVQPRQHSTQQKDSCTARGGAARTPWGLVATRAASKWSGESGAHGFAMAVHAKWGGREWRSLTRPSLDIFRHVEPAPPARHAHQRRFFCFTLGR